MKSNYIDITKKWRNEKSNFSNRNVIDMKYYKNLDGKIYYVDGKNVVLDYSKEEYNCAMWLSKTFSEIVYMVPRVNIPEGIQTPDFIFKGEKFDLKCIKGKGKNTLDNAIKAKKNQSSNFIFIIYNLEESIFKKQIKKIFFNKRRKWINIIIIKNKNDFCVLKRKKEVTPAQMCQDNFYK